MNAPELIAAAYLRLNGFLLLPNFTVFDGAQHTDVDLIGVRAPNARERVGAQSLPTDGLFLEALGATSTNEWIAVAAQVKGNSTSAFPAASHVDYVRLFVGEGTALKLLCFKESSQKVRSRADGIEVGLEHAVDWIWSRFSWMDEHVKPLTKDGSWAWSEPFLGALLALKRAGLVPRQTAPVDADDPTCEKRDPP